MLTGGDAKIEVVEGDGRISLEAENREQSREPFDILVLDAFSSDAVPVHLLTREALSSYRAALKPDGVLAVHISNRYLNLAPVVARAGSSVDMRNLVAFNPTLPGDHSDFSRWIFLSSARMRMRQLHQTLAKAVQPAQEGRRSPMTLHFVPQNRLLKVPLWTDDWSDLWSTLARRSGTQAAPAAPRIAP
jgi:spermidine synthase